MENLAIFDYIERACAVLDENVNGFTHAADRLSDYLRQTFGGIDALIDVTSRIKTRDSLKEKILRNSLYKDYPAERLVFEMHDIIGVRLDCRFFKDEEFLFKRIKEVFDTEIGGGLYAPSGKKAIRLKLDVPQPEKQKNGFNIYRIDGNVLYAGECYNFELQIKSLVNSFWSEIEHKLIYKNIRYSQSDTLMKELLNSIHESLSGVDHQLNLIFDRFAGNSLTNQQAQLENMLALGINEVYSAIIRAHTGISVSISDYSEAVVIYLLSASSYMKDTHGTSLRGAVTAGIYGDKMPPEAADYMNGSPNYSNVIIELMDWMRNVDYSNIAIGGKIDVSPTAENPEVCRVFLKNINEDFYLNTFFHIFFSLERGSNDEDFASYIKYYSDRILGGKTQEQMYRTLAALEDVPAHKLPLEKTILSLANVK